MRNCFAFSRFLPIAVCILLSALSVGGSTLEIRASRDAFIRASQSAANTSNESNGIFIVGDTLTPNDYLRGLLSFDTRHSALVGTQINRVQLILTISSRDLSSGGSLHDLIDLDLHRLDVDYIESEVDWYHRSNSDLWQNGGGDFGALLDRVQANPATVDEEDVIVFSSPYLTEDFIKSIGGDYALLLKLRIENQLRSVFRFCSRSAAYELQPVLLVDYTPSEIVVPVPGHLERPDSARYSLMAGGRSVAVKAERYSFDVAMFTMGDGVVAIDIECASDFTSYTLKPDRYGLEVSRSGNRLHFQIESARNMVLQIPGRTPLAIIVTPLERGLPDPSDPDVRYFWPGIQDVGVIRPRSGQTIYFAPGALVKGRIEAKGVSDVRVCGRGILETAGYSVRSEGNAGILFENSENIIVEGIGVRSFYTWWQTLYLNCRDVEVAHSNIFGIGVNTDGVDIDAVKNFVVRDSFIRAEDDGLGWHSLNAALNGEMITENALADNIVIWNTGAGNGIRIGASMEAQLWRNITIRNVDILQHAGAGIYSDYSDWAWMENLRFENIVIEKASKPIDFYIGTTIYSNSTSYLNERGHMDGVVFESVTMQGGLIRFAGFDDTHRINNLRFINCVNQGDPVNSLSDISVNAFVTDIGFDEKLTPYPSLDPGSFVLADLESTTRGGVQYIEDFPSALKGRRRVFIGRAVGDSMEHTFSVSDSGHYRLKLGGWGTPESARVNVYLNDALIGTEDLYQTTELEQIWDFGPQDLAAGGSYRLRIEIVGSSVASSGYHVRIDELKILSDLQAWRDDYFGRSANTGDGSDANDPDGDGVVNLFEYMIGTHPIQLSDSTLLSLGTDGECQYVWKHPIPALLDCRVEVSSDLSEWDTMASIAIGANEWSWNLEGLAKWPEFEFESIRSEDGSDIQLRLKVKSELGPDRIFYRLRVAEP
ncbi:glycosyl hydrolase family 28 protein [Coraliomargarita sp. SDUM461004]|uniref:Probable pectate lyase C n=1 Tax=Thalassobacterium sedimentorum TaxID=3041258 RepID=A0ABU1AFU1_9BACT|nr:glycosyl hydrolase family 28 protein [Coraliomargarita sp. SDUM461004]MDQ8193650.1 glycosyl hydrolase family 28 protein [Coraliomargarita sp. SDUM461004]